MLFSFIALFKRLIWQVALSNSPELAKGPILGRMMMAIECFVTYMGCIALVVIMIEMKL